MHCAKACVPTQPAVCLLSLLYATIQRSLLCACSAFYMPQYSRAYYVPAQPSIFHNTAKPTVCLLSLLYATIQPSLLCACSAFYMPQYNRAYFYCNTIPPAANPCSFVTIQSLVLQHYFQQPTALSCNTNSLSCNIIS